MDLVVTLPQQAGGHAPTPRYAAWRLPVTVLVLSVPLACISVWPLWRTDAVTGAITALVAVALWTTSAVLWADPIQRGNARALGLCGLLWLVSWWYVWEVGPLPLLGECFNLWFVFGGLVLLRYPEPVLSHRFERVFLAALGGWVFSAQITISLVSLPEWQGFDSSVWWPALFPNRALNDALVTAYYGLTSLSVVIMLVLLLLKLRRVRGIDRIDAIPVTVAAGSAAIMGGAYLVINLLPHTQDMIDAVLRGLGLSALITPLAFLMVVLNRELVRASVADLVVGIGTATTPTIAQIQQPLRGVLRDPTLQLWLWLPALGTYINDNGATAPAPTGEDRWPILVRGRHDEPLALLLVAPALKRHPRLIESAVVASGLALENGRLHADLEAQLAEVRASRTRIVEASMAERRRIERDLHDGAQQSLLTAAASLGVARIHSAEDKKLLDAIDQARADVQIALHDLRDLARGIHPAALSQSGLASALGAMAERIPLRVTLSVPDLRFTQSIEATIYFVTCEALANTVKHAHATTATITIRVEGARATVQIRDNGRGDARIIDQGGLAGIADRVRALGGEFHLESPSGKGTTVTASIPCE